MSTPPLPQAAERQITLTNVAVQFACREDESLLHGMRRTGRKGIPVGCQGGGCGVCRVRVQTGDYTTRTMSRDHISAEGRQAGEALACRVFPRCDLQVDVIGPLRRRMT